jgi:endogenous inhibitor of DNA gyrase (YacG/DUF329 family)
VALYFTGQLEWICPYCGKENSSIQYSKTYCASFIVLDDDKIALLSAGTESEVLRCPGCHKPVNAAVVREGFDRWLEKLREENPEKYARLIATLLER